MLALATIGFAVDFWAWALLSPLAVKFQASLGRAREDAGARRPQTTRSGVTKNGWLRLVEADPGHSAWYIDRFRSMADSGVDLAGEARFVDALVPRAARVLDAGCGTGRVGGFGAGRGYEFGTFLENAGSAGLVPDLLLATWDLRPFDGSSDFLVAVLRPGPTDIDSEGQKP